MQARVIPVGEGHRDAAGALRERLVAEGFRVDVDERDETLGKRIRDAELEKVPFVVVYGDRESDDALAVRERGGEQSTLSLDELLGRFRASSPPRRIRTVGASDPRVCKQELTASSPPGLDCVSRGGSTEPAVVSTRLDETAAACSGSCRLQGGS